MAEENTAGLSAAPALLDTNRAYYDSLWSGANLVSPERFNTWPLVQRLAAEHAARLEIAPGLRPRLPIEGTQFLDISTPALRKLQARGASVVTGLVTSLPFGIAAFDLVCALDIVEHVSDEAAVFGELERVLRPGGTLLLSVPLHPSQWTPFDDFVGHCRRYEPQLLWSRLEEHGFTVQHSAVFGMQPKSSRLLELGHWYLTNRREQALWWYNRAFMPLGLRFQKKLQLVAGKIDTAGVDEIYWYAAKPGNVCPDEQIPAARCVREGLSTVRRFAGALVLACLATACSSAKFFIANAPNSFSHQQQHLDLRYGTQPRQALDIIAPAHANNCPVVIFWYGGSWMEGKKSDYRFVGTALAKQGFVVVIPDYRLYPQVTFPAFDEDAARAVAWVQHHVADYGGDAKHIVLMGHSAGGHTAAFLAFNRALLQKFGADPHGISGLVGLSGTYVFVPDSDELRAAFPPPYTIQDWQPIKFVDAQSPPTLLLHGLADREVLPQEAIDLRDALRAAHVPVQLELFAHRGHADTVASFADVTRWRTPALADTVSFIRRVTQATPGTSP